MRSISQVVGPTSTSVQSRFPTLEAIASEHPGWVRIIYNRMGTDFSPVAEVRVPYSPEASRLLRACKPGWWDPAGKTWVVTALAGRKLSEALYVLARHSR
jgi:hypothetical protein